MPEDTTTTAAETAADTAVTETTPAAETPSAELGWFDSLDRAIAESEKPKEEKTEGTTEETAGTTTDDKPKEEKPEEDAEVKNMTPNAGAKFKEIKAEAKAARARITELETQLAEAQKGGAKPDAAEAERLQAAITERETKIAEYEKELAISRFEATPEYRAAVVEPMAAILNVVERLAKKYEVSEKKLLSVLEESDPDTQGDMITDLASGFSERDRVSLYAMGDDYTAILSTREEMRARAADALKAREAAAATEATRKAAEDKRVWEETSKKVWDTLKTKIPLPGDEEARQKIEAEVTAQVAGVQFDSLTPELKAFASYSGALVPHVVKRNRELESEVASLNEALKKYQKSTPGAGAGAETVAGAVPDNVGFLDAIEKRIGG